MEVQEGKERGKKKRDRGGRKGKWRGIPSE